MGYQNILKSMGNRQSTSKVREQSTSQGKKQNKISDKKIKCCNPSDLLANCNFELISE